MKRDDWMKTDAYEKKNREVNGIFTEWPLPSEIVAGKKEAQAGSTAPERPKVQ